MFLFEVLDKEPTLVVIYTVFIGLGVVGFILSMFRWWASIPILLFLGLSAFFLLIDFNELYADIVQEDRNYIPLATFAIVVGLVLPIVGVTYNLVRRFKAFK